MSNEYDVIVIGGGPAGYPAAIRAAQNKLKVACIDEWKNKDGTAVFGGTCTNAGCIPSKALLESSELYHKTKDELGVHGIKVSGVTFDVAQMQKRKTGIVKASTRASPCCSRAPVSLRCRATANYWRGARWNSPRTTARKKR